MKRVCKIYYLTLLVCISLSNINAQSFTISGFLSNKETGEVLIGAYVICPQTGSGSVTNNYGYYAISVPYGTKNILYIGEGFYAKIDTLRIS